MGKRKYTLQKSNATRLWAIIFLLSWIFIHRVRYPRKAWFVFRLMPYLLGLFHWGAWRVSKLGAMSKRRSCKIDRIVWEMHAISSFGLFCECMHAYHCPFIAPKSSESFEGFQLFLLTLPPIYSPCTRPNKTILTNKASIERQINRLSRDI